MRTVFNSFSPGRRLAMAIGLCAAATAGGASAAIVGQDAVQAAPPAPAPAPASASTPDWHPFSRSTANIYMVDVNGIVVEGDVKRVTMARAPRTGAVGDYTHTLEVVEFRCAAGESRSLAEIGYGPDGAQGDRYDDASDWQAYGTASRDAHLGNLVCGTDRAAPPTWASVKAWVDAGRP